MLNLQTTRARTRTAQGGRRFKRQGVAPSDASRRVRRLLPGAARRARPPCRRGGGRSAQLLEKPSRASIGQAGYSRRVRARLAGRPEGQGTSRWPTAPATTIRTCWTASFFRRSAASISRTSPEAVADWNDTAAANRPTYQAHAYSLLRAIMRTAADPIRRILSTSARVASRR